MFAKVHEVTDTQKELQGSFYDRVYDAYAPTHGPETPSSTMLPVQGRIVDAHTMVIDSCPFMTCTEPHVVRDASQYFVPGMDATVVTRGLLLQCKLKLWEHTKGGTAMEECGRYQVYLVYAGPTAALVNLEPIGIKTACMTTARNSTQQPTIPMRRRRCGNKQQLHSKTCWRNGLKPQLQVQDTFEMRTNLHAKKAAYFRYNCGWEGGRRA